MRVSKILGLLALVALLLLLSARFLIHGDWNKTEATLSDNGAVRAVVHGYTDNPLTGWTTHLVWNRDDDKWLVFYLNHEAYFERYELKKRDADIEVYCNEVLIAKLDTTTGKLFHVRQNLMYEKPVDVIHQANMDDRDKWLRWDKTY
jgi:hypothetical protein